MTRSINLPTDLPWLGMPLALDLANTIIIEPAGERDLFDEVILLLRWISVERTRYPQANSLETALQQGKELRQAIRETFFYHCANEEPGQTAVATINEFSALAAGSPILQYQHKESAHWTQIWVSQNQTTDAHQFLGHCARSAIDVLTGPSAEVLSVCHAPSCGMFYLKEHQRRIWCSPQCANRARAARHYARKIR